MFRTKINVKSISKLCLEYLESGQCVESGILQNNSVSVSISRPMPTDQECHENIARK